MNKESDQNVVTQNRSRVKESTQRARNIRLPTPPPDPTTICTSSNIENTQNQQHVEQPSSATQIDVEDALNKESELLEYILSLSSQKSPTSSEGGGNKSAQTLTRTNSLFAQAIAADEAFDHLDKLYKLMEQLLNLREQNSKLQKRVRDLEHLKKMQDMHLKLNYNPDDKIILQDLEADPGYAESLLDNILAAGRNASQKRNSKYKPNQSRFRQSLLGRPHERSCSVAMDDNYSPYHDNIFTYSDGNIYPTNKLPFTNASKPAKVSKWKKVKAAFKWEKACSTVGGNLPVTKSQDSGLGLPIINNEVAKYLRVPSITGGHSGSSGGGVSPADSVLSGQSSPGGIRTSGKDLSISVPETPASLSSASSMEDIQNHEIDESQKDVLAEKSSRQRFSTCSDEESLQDHRRSKSFDEDTILGKDEDNIYYTKHWNYKMHKTPWGKVKDIIQTRKDSLKKSRVRINSKVIDDHINSDRGISPNRTHRRSESNVDVCSFSSEEYPEVFEPPPIDQATINYNSIQGKDCSVFPSNNSKVMEIGKVTQNLQTKRPTPLLTVTISNSEKDNSIKSPETPSTSDKKNNLPPEVIRRYQELVHADKIRPTYRYNSRWHRVKKAFLNKHAVEESIRNVEYKSLSTPASPTRNSSFFSEDSDDLSNNALKDYFTYHYKRNKSPQSTTQRHIQEEIQKNYEELQNKLSLEFQEKMLEWERLKSTTSSSSQNQNVFTSQNLPTISTNFSEEPQMVTEGDCSKKLEDSDRIKPRSPNSSKFKEIPTTPITSSDHLSAEFKKKLQEWQRIKKEQSTTPQLQHSASTKKKITDNWQFFKAGATPRTEDHSKTFRYPDTKQLSEDFLKKLEEWKHMKATNTVPSYSAYRHEEDDSSKNYSEAKPSSPGFKRKESTMVLKSPRQSAKKTKIHENKELQILEKEIQKIEREKQRLEREREKYLEREERLAKLRRSIGANQAKKEVLVQTSTGFFRFQGISRKFTQRLYEWEKARGIGPEESTLTLLSPSYKSILPGSNTRKTEDINQSQTQGRLVRSKSMDSVANLTSNQIQTSITHQPSSLSLNDMEELEAECLAEAHAESMPDHLPDIDTFEEPEAVIVDVEDVEEETAAPLQENIAIPVCVTHTPVYRYEQQQDDMLCEGEECLAPKVQGGDSTKTQSSYNLIEENITLLNKLKDKEEICKQLESDIEDIEGEMNDLEKTHNELEKLNNENKSDRRNSQNNLKQSKIQELERKKRRLRNEGVNLHNSFTEHKAQQSLLAQHLVGSMRRLQEINTSVALNVPKKEITSSSQQLMDVTEMVQDLSSELLSLAEKLQSFLNQRNKESSKTKSRGNKKLTREKQWRSVDLGTETSCTVSRRSRENSTEAEELSSLLTNKILELKRGLSYICAASDLTAPRPNKKTIKRKKYNSTSNETLSTNKDRILIEKSDSVPNVTLTPTFLHKDSATVSKQKNLSKNEDTKLIIKSEVKRKIRTRSRNDLKYSIESDDEINYDESTKKSNRPYKSHKNKQVSEENFSSQKSLGNINQCKNEMTASRNVLVDTNPQFVKYENNFRPNSPADVLVKTTKTVFLPPDSNLKDKNSNNDSNDICSATEIVSNDVDKPENEIIVNNSKTLESKELQNITGLYKDMSPIHSPTALRQRRLIKTRTSSLSCDENTSCILQKQDSETNVIENIAFIGNYDQPKHLLQKTLSSDAVASSLPPLPHSPTPLRRDRGLTKETAPSIRLMIARYNQRLCEQDGGKSPGGSSGSGSPVAWRSPVLERRVRAQTEKYQEEIRRVLQQGSWRKNEITKSASVGFIQTNVIPPKKPQTSMEAFVKISEIPNTPPSKRKLRGILKSSSAGSLKIDNQAQEIILNHSKLAEVSKSNDHTLEHQTIIDNSKSSTKVTMHTRSLSVTNTPPKIVRKYDMRSVSPKIQISSSPESPQNSPNSLRALKIQRAKEDFLARQISSPEFTTSTSHSESDKKQTRCHFDVNYVPPHRLSQVSCGSESSCDDHKAEGILIKSASAGMINIDANTYRQLAASEMHSLGYVSLPRSNRSHKDILGGKFGISSITSKFRKVKMRRNKEKDPNKMNTISMLCRQSLFVDINDNSGELLNHSNAPSTSQEFPTQRARSKSTSSSPVFQRQLSDSNKSSSTSGWKSKIIKPKQ